MWREFFILDQLKKPKTFCQSKDVLPFFLFFLVILSRKLKVWATLVRLENSVSSDVSFCFLYKFHKNVLLQKHLVSLYVYIYTLQSPIGESQITQFTYVCVRTIIYLSTYLLWLGDARRAIDRLYTVTLRYTVIKLH